MIFQKLMISCLFCFVISCEGIGQKIGYVDLNRLITLTPDARRVDSLLISYQKDSIGRQFDILIKDYKYRDSILSSKDTLTMPLTVKQEHQYALQTAVSQIQNWQNISQELISKKQNELLRPLYSKLIKVIENVAKEKGYAYVFDKSVLIIGPKADDLLPIIAEKLKIKIPPRVLIGVNGIGE